LLFHIHTSSGRVPTKEGFKRYVGHLKPEDIAKDTMAGLQVYEEHSLNLNEVIERTLEVLTRFSGYTSLVAISGQNEKVFYKGMRFILEQPEFENIACLRDIFNTLEVHMDELHDILFNCIDEKIQILIGDDIGFSEISNCSLIVSGLREEPLQVALAVLGPMRMDYLRAASCLYSVRNQLKGVVEELI
jgi:transcriptional regulator of heat shock response